MNLCNWNGNVFQKTKFRSNSGGQGLFVAQPASLSYQSQNKRGRHTITWLGRLVAKGTKIFVLGGGADLSGMDVELSVCITSVHRPLSKHLLKEVSKSSDLVLGWAHDSSDQPFVEINRFSESVWSGIWRQWANFFKTPKWASGFWILSIRMHTGYSWGGSTQKKKIHLQLFGIL